jgi:hypothetical protein
LTSKGTLNYTSTGNAFIGSLSVDTTITSSVPAGKINTAYRPVRVLIVSLNERKV